MRLVTFHPPGSSASVVGVATSDGAIVDLAHAYAAYLKCRGASLRSAKHAARALIPTGMVGFIAGGAASLNAAATAIDWIANEAHDLGRAAIYDRWDVRLLSPIPRPPLIRDFMAFEGHLKNIYPRLGRDIPREWYEMPVYYKGNPASVSGDSSDVVIPQYATELDYEVELAFVIGSGGMDIRSHDATSHIYGYMLYNDLSAREIQAREMAVGLGPAKGKDFRGGHALGPVLVTADEISDPYDLTIEAAINGDLVFHGSTASIHWRFDEMIAHASRDEMLMPGEVFGSGTLPGGSGMEADRVLRPGDEITLRCGSIGELTSRIAARPVE